MQDNEHGMNFWLGNAVLVLALVMLLEMGTMWQRLGPIAFLLWAAVAGLGAWLVMSDQRRPPNFPD